MLNLRKASCSIFCPVSVLWESLGISEVLTESDWNWMDWGHLRSAAFFEAVLEVFWANNIEAVWGDIRCLSIHLRVNLSQNHSFWCYFLWTYLSQVFCISIHMECVRYTLQLTQNQDSLLFIWASKRHLSFIG